MMQGADLKKQFSDRMCLVEFGKFKEILLLTCAKIGIVFGSS